MDTPPDFQGLRRQTVRGSARCLYGGGVTDAPGRRGRNPGAETCMTARPCSADAPTILCFVRAAAATPPARGRTA